MPLSAAPTKRAAACEALRWQDSEEPLQGGAAAAAAKVGSLLTWAKRAVRDAAEEDRCQPGALIKRVRPRSESPQPCRPKQSRRELPRPHQPKRCCAPPPHPPPGSRWDVEGPRGSLGDVKGPQEQEEEDALACLCKEGVDDPRVLLEFRQLHQKDALAARGVLERLCWQAAADGLEKPNNYARSLTSEARFKARLWT